MIREGSLCAFKLILKVRTPVHIGSGQQVMKNEYLFNAETGEVTMLDVEKMLMLLAQKGFADRYEEHILSGERGGLNGLMRICGLTRDDLSSAILYKTKAGDALDEDHQLSQINRFIRTAEELPYIPGSSLKGAIRTILLHKLISTGGLTEQESGDRRLEDKIINTLPIPGGKDFDMTRSVMRGLLVSDSEPVSNDCMILAGKTDVSTFGNPHPINKVVRECAAPGTRFCFMVTIDSSLIDLTPDSLMAAIRDYRQYYRREYSSRFKQPERAVADNDDNIIILGGGSGYFSKNIVYHSIGYDKGLRRVSQYMTAKFKDHHHDNDEKLGISPHMIKYTRCGGSLRQFGLCEVSIE